MAYVAITPVDVTPASTDWQDVDGAAEGVPAGAKALAIAVVTMTASHDRLGIRCNGSTDDRITHFYTENHYVGIVGCDANRVIEVSHTTDTTWYLLGYFDSASDITMFVDAEQVTLSSTAIWEDVDLSSITGANAIQLAFVEPIRGSFGGFGIRADGDTTDMSADNSHSFQIVPVNSSTKGIEVYRESGHTDHALYVQGYMSSGATVHETPIDVSPVTTDTWTDLAASQIGADAIVYRAIHSSYYNTTGIRTNGSSADIKGTCRQQQSFIAEPDGAGLCEVYSETTNPVIYEIGYIGGVETNPVSSAGLNNSQGLGPKVL